LHNIVLYFFCATSNLQLFLASSQQDSKTDFVMPVTTHKVGRTSSKARTVASTTAATGVDICGVTQFNFMDDMMTCNKKPVAFVGRRGKKIKVSKAPSKVVQVKEVAAVEVVDLKHQYKKIEAVETVKLLPPPDFKVVATS
jgi:hypothetical protein